MADIRKIYRQFTDAQGADKVNLQGIVFDTNEGGRLPLAAYLRATLEWRARLEEKRNAPSSSGASDDGLNQLAAERGLSAKYLASLWQVLNDSTPSLVLDGIRTRFRLLHRSRFRTH